MTTRDLIKKLIPKYCRGNVIDIGGGTGKYRSIINPYADSYITTDIDPGVKPDYVEDARRMSFPDKSFDTVLSFQLLEHVDDTAAVISEMYRILKINGYAVVNVPFMAAQHGDPSDYHRFTQKGLEWYFKQAGFSVVESGTQGGAFAVLSEMLRFAKLNPYKTHNKVSTFIVRNLCSVLNRIDSSFNQNSNFYTDSYVVARKVK